MFRFKLMLIACLALMAGPQDKVESILSCTTQQSQESSQPAAATKAEEAQISAEVAQIMAIRAQLGGGIAKTLGDLSLEMPGKKPESVPNNTKALSLEQAFAEKLAEQSRSYVAKKISRQTVMARAVPKSGARISPEKSEAVRHAARMLEEAAALLEEAEQYQQADSVRTTAGELWRSARAR